MKIISCIFIFLLVGITFNVFSQNSTAKHNVNVEIPEVAVLGLISQNMNSEMITIENQKSANTIRLNSTGDSKIWLNYSSIISKEKERKVMAVLEGDLPEGIKIKLKASDYQGSGKGIHGKASGEILLSNQPTDVVTGIGSCYTGSGINNGHFLTYELEEDNIALAELNSLENNSVNVIYTLTDCN